MSNSNEKPKTLRELAIELREQQAQNWEKNIPAMTVRRDLPTIPTPLDFVIDNFESAQLAIITAPGGTGKGFLEIQLSIAVAARAIKDEKTGKLHCPFKIWQKTKEEGEKVLFLTVEDSKIVIENRLIAMRNHFNANNITGFKEAIENIDIIAMGGGRAPKLAVRQGNQQDLPSAGPLLKILRDLITKNKYRLIILDPLGKLHELNENSNEDMTRLLEMIEDEVI
ncbi:hypothetical protein VZ95_20300, partial [Elstera litoralis]